MHHSIVFYWEKVCYLLSVLSLVQTWIESSTLELQNAVSVHTSFYLCAVQWTTYFPVRHSSLLLRQKMRQYKVTLILGILHMFVSLCSSQGKQKALGVMLLWIPFSLWAKSRVLAQNLFWVLGFWKVKINLLRPLKGLASNNWVEVICL